LTRLGRRDGAAIVEQVVGKKSLPPEVSAQIVAKTDGVPLFLEELTKTVLESGLLRDAGDSYQLSGALLSLAIPATLQDWLLARLDRMAPVKEIAQIGAVIGRKFSHALLAAVTDRPEAELRSALDQLILSELVYRRGSPPEATYTFKHALVQDAAYGTLLKYRRQHLHARVARLLEERAPDIAATQPELLAHHSTEAGLVDKGVDYLWRAGQAALAHSAPAEACGHLRKALDLLILLPDVDSRAELVPSRDGPRARPRMRWPTLEPYAATARTVLTYGLRRWAAARLARQSGAKVEPSSLIRLRGSTPVSGTICHLCAKPLTRPPGADCRVRTRVVANCRVCAHTNPRKGQLAFTRRARLRPDDLTRTKRPAKEERSCRVQSDRHCWRPPCWRGSPRARPRRSW
jgi:hypothetical protein